MTASLITSLVVLAALAGVVWGKKDWPPIPQLRKLRHRLFPQPSADRFKIRVGFGDSPIDVSELDSAEAVTIGPEIVADIPAVMVADPFLHVHEDRIWIFFEALDARDRKGVIGSASSGDGRNWRYEGIVLCEDFHLSYPLVVKWDGKLWMIPETHEDNSVRLYESTGSPSEWKFHSRLLVGHHFADATPFQEGGRWYMFVTIDRILFLYHAESLFGPWIMHPSSPVKSPPEDRYRCGGRVQAFDGSLIRMAQLSRPYYGRALDGIDIDRIDEHVFDESDATFILEPDRSSSWRPFGVHHLESTRFQNRWVICADGF